MADKKEQSKSRVFNNSRNVLPNLEWMRKSREDVPAPRNPLTENPFLKLERQATERDDTSLTQTDSSNDAAIDRKRIDYA